MFVETSAFTKKADAEGPEIRLLIEAELLQRPEAGSVIPGAGGVRKLRVMNPNRGKGKRGGYRVIYLDVPEMKRIFLVTLYCKGEKTDVSQAEVRDFKRMADFLKQEAR